MVPGNNQSSSLISRRRPSTGPPQAPSRHLGKTHGRPNELPVSSKGPQPVVRWDGTAVAWTPGGRAINNGAVRSSNINSSHCRPSSTGPGVKYAEKQSSRRVSGNAASTTPQHSPLSSPSFFASSIATDATTTNDGDATTGDPQTGKGNDAWRQTTVESKATTARKNLVNTVAKKPTADGNSLRAPIANATGVESTGSRPAVGHRRPSSASGSLIQGSLTHLNSSTSTRPHTVGGRSVSRTPFGAASSEGFRDVTSGGGDALTEDRLLIIRGTASGGDFPTGCGEESRGPGSLVGGRVSVSVVLPVLEKESDARDER